MINRPPRKSRHIQMPPWAQALEEAVLSKYGLGKTSHTLVWLLAFWRVFRGVDTEVGKEGKLWLEDKGVTTDSEL